MCAAKFIQAVVRGRQSRLRILSQRRSTQLLLKWAGTRIALSVSSQRERWQAQADARPLLLRPDSHFMAHWKLLVVATVALEWAGILLGSEDGDKIGIDQLLQRTATSECVPHTIDGPRLLLLGPRSRVQATLPDYCTAVGDGGLLAAISALAHHTASVLTTSSPEDVHAALLTLLSSLLAVIVALIAVADTLIEYFTGVIDPVTGCLEPKSHLARYVIPPYSLLFNLGVNPALSTANAVLSKLLVAGDGAHFFRIVIWLQPVAQHAEAHIAPCVRRFMRRYHVIHSSPRGMGTPQGLRGLRGFGSSLRDALKAGTTSGSASPDRSTTSGSIIADSIAECPAPASPDGSSPRTPTTPTTSPQARSAAVLAASRLARPATSERARHVLAVQQLPRIRTPKAQK